MVSPPSVIPCRVEGPVLPVAIPFLYRVIPEWLNLADEPVGARSTLTDHHVREADTPLRIEKLVCPASRRYGAAGPIVRSGLPVHYALANPCPFTVVMLPGIQAGFVTFPVLGVFRVSDARRGRQ